MARSGHGTLAIWSGSATEVRGNKISEQNHSSFHKTSNHFVTLTVKMIDQAVQISGQRGKGKKLFFSKYYAREEDKFDHVKLWRQNRRILCDGIDDICKEW